MRGQKVRNANGDRLTPAACHFEPSLEVYVVRLRVASPDAVGPGSFTPDAWEWQSRFKDSSKAVSSFFRAGSAAQHSRNLGGRGFGVQFSNSETQRRRDLTGLAGGKSFNTGTRSTTGTRRRIGQILAWRQATEDWLGKGAKRRRSESWNWLSKEMRSGQTFTHSVVGRLRRALLYGTGPSMAGTDQADLGSGLILPIGGSIGRINALGDERCWLDAGLFGVRELVRALSCAIHRAALLAGGRRSQPFWCRSGPLGL